MTRTARFWLVGLLGVAACGGPSPSAPVSAVPATLTPVTLGSRVTFAGFSTKGAPVTSYSESGYTVSAVAGSWFAETGYGNVAPSLQFYTNKGERGEGRIDVTAGGATFPFASVDLYSSITPIPYVITGTLKGATVFTLSGTVPNTFGQFRTVTNAQSSALIDTLSITLSQSPVACCGNPMGVDNLNFGQ